MNIDSDKVQALYQLSVDKTFSKASESLGISQPALSKKIARLEEELESNLVIRNSKGIIFTDAGLEIIKYYKLKKDLDLELISKLSFDKGTQFFGEVNIATYSSIGRSAVLPSLSLLLSEFDGLKVNFLIKETRELEESFLTGEVNFILSNEEIDRENIVNQLIGFEENVHIIPSLANFPDVYLDHDKYDQTTINFLKLQGKKTSIKRNYFDEIYGIIDAVKLGFGQAIVSKHLVKNDEKIKIIKSKKRILSKKESNYLLFFCEKVKQKKPSV